MKQLFRIKIEHEEFVWANNEEEALENFWEARAQNNETVDTFIDECTKIEMIMDKNDIPEEDEEVEDNDEQLEQYQ